MKVNNLIVPVVIVMALAACTSSVKNENSADTVIQGDTVAKATEAEATSLCFLRTEGKSNKDTTSVELVIKNDKVSGQMYWHPFEKDSRKGTLNGDKKGDTVNVVWSYMQEGMQDTLGLQFLIKDDNLMQRPLKVNTQTGRQQTDNAAGFTVLYKPSVSLKK